MNDDLPVHPFAAVFPLLVGDELLQLAQDIVANGLIHPIVLDAQGRVLDGRNRLAACKLVGVEPRFVTLDPPSVMTFVVSQNVHRRHLARGARAMAIVGAYLAAKADSTQGPRTLRDTAKLVGVPFATLSQAHMVHQFAPEYVPQVLAGGSLEEAHGIAQIRQRAREANKNKLRRLRRTYPDLAAQVRAGKIELEAAMHAAAMLDRAQSLAKDQHQIREKIQLRQEQIDVQTPENVALPRDEEMIPQGPHRAPPKVGEVLGEILAEIDEAALDRAADLRDRLKLADRLLAVIEPYEPTYLAAGLRADEAEYVASVLWTAMRWIAVARQAALKAAEPGHLEVVR